MRKFPKTFSDILTMKHEWPKKGDRLMQPSDDWETAVSFAPDQISRDAFLWEGYMTAGAALIDEAERRPHDRHVLIYPILFNYRHALEIAMKWTIDMYGRIANVRLDDEDHNLWRLWQKCKVILRVVPTSDEDEPLQAVERIVKELHDLDKNGVALRYSKHKDGRTIVLPAGSVDLANVQRKMEAVDGFFKGADGLLSDILSAVPDDY